jgi:undecaprenyl-diphosphatase
MKYKKIIIKCFNSATRDITSLGSSLFSTLFFIILLFINKKTALFFLLGYALIETINASIKTIWHKTRPNKQKYSNIIEKIDSGSFPSTHASRIIFIGLTIFHLFQSNIILLLIIPLIILIGISRISLKKHYLTDIIAGYIIGFIIWTILF